MQLFARRHKPGTLVSEEVIHVKARVSVIAYSQDDYEEMEAKSVEECFQHI